MCLLYIPLCSIGNVMYFAYSEYIQLIHHYIIIYVHRPFKTRGFQSQGAVSYSINCVRKLQN